MWKWITDWISSWFKKNPLPIPTPNPEPDVETLSADEIPITGVVIHKAPANTLSWPINVGIKRCWRDNLWRWEYDRACPWTDLHKGAIGNNWLFLKIGDVWHGGPGDWLRKGENYKNFSDVKFELDGEVVRPTSGQEFGFMLSTPARGNVRTTGARTQIKLCVAP